MFILYMFGVINNVAYGSVTTDYTLTVNGTM